MRESYCSIAARGSFLLFGAVGMATVTDARTVSKGQSVVVSGPGNVRDLWELSQGSTLTLRDAVSNYVNAYAATLVMDGSTLESSRGTGVNASYGSFVDLKKSTLHDTVRTGLSVFGGLSGTDARSVARMEDSSATGKVAGAIIGGYSELEAHRSVLRSSDDAGIGLVLTSGRVELADGTEVTGGKAGASLGAAYGLTGGPARLTVTSGSVITGRLGPAVLVDGGGNDNHLATLNVRDGGSLEGADGTAVAVTNAARFRLNVQRASVVGDIVASEDSISLVRLGQGGRLDGRVSGPVGMVLDRNSVWSVSSGSRINALTLNGGAFGFSPASAGARSLHVMGNIDGTAGDLAVNVHMGGDASTSWSDSMLVEGHVDVLRPVDVTVNLTGIARRTDVDGDGKASASEGFSLVKVGGTSTPGAFRLKGGYVTHGAYQYDLKAFQGAEIHDDGNALEGGPVQWDYRLAERMVSKEEGCECSGGEQERPAVAPQIPSYLSAPAAVFAYADGMSTSLHERLGEIRDHAFEGSVGGEMFARYSGRSQRYSSDRSFKSYGYDFDESVESWQFGGSIIGLDGDNGSLRAGLAIDHGRSTIVPRAVDGTSVTRLRANGTSAWVTWRSGNGFWVDWVVGQERMRGQTDTSLGGRAVGRVKATSTGISFAAGLPFRLSHDWSVEPHVLVATQGLRFDPIREQSGLDVKFGRGRYVSKTAGMTLFRHNEVMAPFVRLDVRSTSGRGTIRAGTAADPNPVSFDGGRAGADYSLAGGLTTQLSARVQAFGEGSYRHYLGRGGFQGWAGNAGVRVTF